MSMTGTTTEVVGAADTGRSAGRSGAAMWLLLALGLAGSFAWNVREMWHRWYPSWRRLTQVVDGEVVRRSLYDRVTGGESYYTHGPLVPLVSLLIIILLIRHTSIQLRRHRLDRFVGFVLLGGSLLLHLVSAMARVNFASCFALVGVLAGLVVVLWGLAALRRLWFPLALLLFMVPLPEVTIYQLAFRLKMIAADWGVALANVLGVLVEHQGNKVLLTGDKMVTIANVCNGLRTMISLTAFGVLYAYVCKLRGGWRVALLAMVIPVALVSNAVRIVSLIIVADVWDVATATDWFHDASGIMVFVLAFLLMFGLERVILWTRSKAGRPATIVPLFHDVRRGATDKGQWQRMIRAIRGPAGGAAVGLVVASAPLAWWLQRSLPTPVSEASIASAVPTTLVVDGQRMQGYRLDLDEQTLDILEHPSYLYHRYVAPGSAWIDFMILFSRDNRKGVHPPDRCLEGGGRDITRAADLDVTGVPGRGVVPCRELVTQLQDSQHYHLYAYRCGDRYTSSFWVQQYWIFINGVRSRNASGGMIRVDTPIVQGMEQARARCVAMMRAALPHVEQNIPWGDEGTR